MSNLSPVVSMTINHQPIVTTHCTLVMSNISACAIRDIPEMSVPLYQPSYYMHSLQRKADTDTLWHVIKCWLNTNPNRKLSLSEASITCHHLICKVGLFLEHGNNY